MLERAEGGAGFVDQVLRRHAERAGERASACLVGAWRGGDHVWSRSDESVEEPFFHPGLG